MIAAAVSARRSTSISSSATAVPGRSIQTVPMQWSSRMMSREVVAAEASSGRRHSPRGVHRRVTSPLALMPTTQSASTALARRSSVTSAP
ncbi:hypothetical protein [Gordonia polyisoprenivorans]|uniref:hypothetical protein n=1 Tax=Gordonia polyisoprenivorans TaxID=84595 RepID=UPI001FCCB8A3|nr:hypothetical protein [Gordonia polyisoprenivorans]